MKIITDPCKTLPLLVWEPKSSWVWVSFLSHQEPESFFVPSRESFSHRCLFQLRWILGSSTNRRCRNVRTICCCCLDSFMDLLFLPSWKSRCKETNSFFVSPLNQLLLLLFRKFVAITVVKRRAVILMSVQTSWRLLVQSESWFGKNVFRFFTNVFVSLSCFEDFYWWLSPYARRR